MSHTIDMLVDHRLGGRAQPEATTAPEALPERARLVHGACECTCLLVAPAGELARRLTADFPRYGVRPVLAADADATRRWLRSWRFDAIVVDTRAPDASVPALLDTLAGLCATPLLLLSTRTAEGDTIAGLERGATDVLAAASSSRLIATKIKRLARIVAAAVQPSGPERGPPHLLQVGSLRLDLRNEQASIQGAQIALPGRGFAVLAALARQLERIVDRTTLSLHLGSTGFLRSRAFDMQISRIRAALAQAGVHDVVIDTVYRRGYRLALRGAGRIGPLPAPG